MKKVVLFFCLVINLFSTSMFAQEVRGCSTRRVIYQGKEYYCGGSEYEYYGWEITNHNSFSVSVDLTLYAQGGYFYNGNTKPAEAVKTQSIILKPSESYIFKREEHLSTRVKCGDSNNPISAYYIEYKAYKMQ